MNTNTKLKEILKEAEHITLDDLEYDTILQEQSNILCDIKQILHNEKYGNVDNSNKFTCNIPNIKNNKTFKKLVFDYHNSNSSKMNSMKINSSSNSSSSNSKKIINLLSLLKTKKQTKQNTKRDTIKYKSKSSSKSKNRLYKRKKLSRNISSRTRTRTRSRTITKSRTKNKCKSKYSSKYASKYDISITKPTIYIKDIVIKDTPPIKNLMLVSNKLAKKSKR
jgi:hypothetical protein